MKTFVYSLFATLVGLCLITTTAHASVVIGGTRVVISPAHNEATLPINNVGMQPALIEAWIDKGNKHSTPDTVHTPFLITPPLFRVDPGKTQTMRIIFVKPNQALPDDRETLYWLNVLEVPPKPTGAAAGKNNLQFAVRSRLKVFYRPDNLPGNAFKAPGKLVFKAALDAAGKVVLKVHNPTPYHITITKVAMPAVGKANPGASGMVAPFGDITLTLKHVDNLPHVGTEFTFNTINDYGAGVAHKATVQP